MLDALVFLPVDRVSDGMRYLQDVVPDNLRCQAKYFDSTYVPGQYRIVVGEGGHYENSSYSTTILFKDLVWS